MNPFYDIAKEGEAQSAYQLENMGKQKEFIRIGKSRRRSDYWGDTSDFWGRGSQTESKAYYSEVTLEDYDRLMARHIVQTKPAYDVEALLDHHAGYFTASGAGTLALFIKHIKFVVLPFIEKHYNKENQKREYVAIVNEWLQQKENTMTAKQEGSIHISIGDHANAQVQVNSEQSHQYQKTGLDKDGVLQFFALLTEAIKGNTEQVAGNIRYEVEAATNDVNAGRPIATRLHAIGGFLKSLGGNVLANVAAAPIFEVVKPYLGL